MGLPSPKEIKKLADACRKAGIKHFKAEGIEFTLSDERPAVKVRAHKRDEIASDLEQVFSQDSWEDLSEEQKLFYSATNTEGTPR